MNGNALSNAIATAKCSMIRASHYAVERYANATSVMSGSGQIGASRCPEADKAFRV